MSKVLIVDDSALMRQLLRELLSSDPQLEVVGAAPDPVRAWELIQRLSPDVITLDVEMPRMDGLTFLERLMRAHPMPVVMVSSLTTRGCDMTLRALELGAIDFVSKPKLDIERGIAELAAELVRKVKTAAAARPRVRRLPAAAHGGELGGDGPAAAVAVARPSRGPAIVTAGPRLATLRTTDVVFAIGASTGGTEALSEVLSAMPADAPGIVIVQHMPEAFTRAFAKRLDGGCKIRVREAADGDRILPGLALLAPGGRSHMEVVRSGAVFSVRLRDAPPVNHHRPSVDTLFHSCAHALGGNAMGAILTGMGADGASGLLAMRRAGARTVAQDEATSIVFGMPKEAIAAGAAEVVAPLDHVAGVLLRFARERAEGPRAAKPAATRRG